MSSRLVLAPGLRVLSRGRDEVQIGLGSLRTLRLPDSPALRRVLSALDRGEAAPVDPASRRALALLAPVLVDADRLAPVGVSPTDAAAVALRTPGVFASRLRRRSQSTVVVRNALATSGHAAPGPDPALILRAAGFTVAEDHPAPAATLLLCNGEPDRTVFDPWVRDGTPHQLVRSVEGEFVIGPLVVPGRTACLRCLDAHHSVDDPMHPVLVGTHHRAARHDAVAEPIDSALAALATGWAVRDLIAHLDGEPAASWSATVRIGPDLGSLSVVSWLRDQACSCAWADTAAGSATMGA